MKRLPIAVNPQGRDCTLTQLEMAEHLLAADYKDAAAVLGGGVLEEHLRQLCKKQEFLRWWVPSR